ncbi:hypothetical protein ISS03_02070 [Patescibacteria group bacterium]|nr:hypothetical protein [Patescibacteria group bacterium]
MLNHLKNKPLLILLTFVTLVFVVFGNSLTNNFVFDDLAIVRNRDELKTISHLPFLFFEPYHEKGLNTDLYRPITMISFSINYFVFGEKPWGFHLVNILLHAIASWLLYLSLFKITNKFRVSLLAAILFLLLPIHTEAINPIVGRAEILSLLFIS